MIRYHARWVVPVCSPPLERGTVAVEGERIAYVGARDEAPIGGNDCDLGDVILLPGLVNAHCHLELTTMRGFLEDLDFRRWILRLTAARRSVLSRAMLLDAARLGLEEGIRAGITTYADTCDSGASFDAMVEAGVRGIVYQEVFGPDPSDCAAALAGLRDKVTTLRMGETSRVRVGVSPHAPYTVSDDLFRATAEYAVRESLPMAIHVAESAMESRLIVDGDGPFADALRRRGIAVRPRAISPIELLARLDVLSARPLLIHCVRVGARDIETVVAARCGVAHCPASNAKFGHGVAPLMELLASGADVGIGSDSVASNNRMDILEEARLALLSQRVRLESAVTPSAADILALATAGGARALGLDHAIGTLEVGKQADLAAFAIGGAIPTFDPVAAAVFAINGSDARFVAVDGRPLLRDGALVGPTAGLADRAERTAEALSAWLAADGELEVGV